MRNSCTQLVEWWLLLKVVRIVSATDAYEIVIQSNVKRQNETKKKNESTSLQSALCIHVNGKAYDIYVGETLWSWSICFFFLFFWFLGTIRYLQRMHFVSIRFPRFQHLHLLHVSLSHSQCMFGPQPMRLYLLLAVVCNLCSHATVQTKRKYIVLSNKSFVRDASFDFILSLATQQCVSHIRPDGALLSSLMRNDANCLFAQIIIPLKNQWTNSNSLWQMNACAKQLLILVEITWIGFSSHTHLECLWPLICHRSYAQLSFQTINHTNTKCTHQIIFYLFVTVLRVAWLFFSGRWWVSSLSRIRYYYYF